MAILTVEQRNNHSLGLGGSHGWYEIAVPGDDHGRSNVALCSELHHVYAK